MTWQVPAAGQWTGTRWSVAGALEGSDPYLVWADLSGFAGMGGLPTAMARVMVQLDPATTPKEFHSRLRTQALGEVNPLYRGFGSDGPRYCTASVKAGFFGAWRGLQVRRYALSQPRITGIEPQVQYEDMMFVDQGRRVLIGVIDDGLPYLHERFRSRSGTRIVGFWDQDSDQAAGTYLHQSDINKLIARLTAPPPARASEARLYEEQRYARMRLTETHGAAVLDLAAGGTHHDIACVQLPLNTYADSSGGSLAAQALDACHFVRSLADASQPVVINLSYGGQAGPHDGSGMLEAALDELLTINPRDLAVVLAAGNSYDADCHARLQLPSRGTLTLHWRVPSSDATESFMELWGADAALGHPGFDVVVKPPGGQASPAIGPGALRVAASKSGNPWCAIVNAALAPKARARALVALAPTVRMDAATRDPAPPGDWEVSITNRGGATTVDAWIERDGPVFRTDIGGKQSTFEDPERRGYVVRAATLSNVASGKLTVVVGAHVAASGQMSDYSSAGDLAQAGYRAGPDLSAPGDESETRPGIEAAGTRSGYVFRMGGTSAAAPQVARLIADFLASQSAPVANADIKAWLASKAQLDDRYYPPGDGTAAPPARAGAGRIKTQS